MVNLLIRQIVEVVEVVETVEVVKVAKISEIEYLQSLNSLIRNPQSTRCLLPQSGSRYALCDSSSLTTLRVPPASNAWRWR